MRPETNQRLLATALLSTAIAFACSSDEKPSSPANTGGDSAASVTSSTSASSGGASAAMGSTGVMSTMGGASAQVTSDAVTVDGTSSTSSSTVDGTTSSTASGGASTSGGGAGGSTATTSMGAGGTTMGGEFTFATTAFDDTEGCTCDTRDGCDTFPEENTNYGGNTSPEFNWSGAPNGTQSFAIVLQDISNAFVHWAIWNIPGSTTMLASGLASDAELGDPAGAQQANFLGGQSGYFGPGACNVYEFTLYALDSPSFTPNPPNPSSTGDMAALKDQLDAAGVLGTMAIQGRADEAYCSMQSACDYEP